MKKIIKEYVYEDLGFPLILLNVPVREIRGVVVPDINYNLLQRSVILALSHKPIPLTGNEVRFIRQYFELNYSKFARIFGVTHASVINWEKAKNLFSKMTPVTEIFMRLYILDVMKTNNKTFRDSFREFNYSLLNERFKNAKSEGVKDYIHIDSSLLIAI